MAGYQGNVAWWALAKQGSGKGSAATLPTGASLIPFSGGSIQPTRETGNLAETDATRDQGLSYVVRTGAEGTPEAYARDSYAHTLFAAALGTVASTGTTNYVHTITPSNSLSYYTIWRNQSDALWEKFTDCFVSELTFKSEAGAPATLAASVMGRTPERLTASPVTTETVNNDPVYNYNTAAVSLGGSSTNLVSSFELSINNNVSVQQTDDVVPYDMVPGQREVNLSFDLILENLNEYNKFFYGSTSGTTASTTISTTSFELTLAGASANNEIKFSIPSLAYEAFPVEPNPNGDPITVSVRAQAQRPSSGSIITATVKNQKSA